MERNPSEFTGCQKPVEEVSWQDCKQFFKKLNAGVADRGIHFRLPTEAEWEYAAKGGNQSKGYKYACSDDIDEAAWYLDNFRLPDFECSFLIHIKKRQHLYIYHKMGASENF